MERLSRLEVACGLALGLDPAAPQVAPAATVRAALAEAILPALRRPPCLVSFSGGRDSSAVLAVATELARREGLPLPIPATNRFPGLASSDETAWQEQVVAHVGSEEWLRLPWDDELDLVGPYAVTLLRRHGLLWPFNLHFHLPLLEAAFGGSLLTGIGGDELLSEWSGARAHAVLSGRARPRPRDALRVGLALAPHAVRRLVHRRRIEARFDWLRPGAREQVLRTLAGETAREPLRASRRASWLRRHRYLRLGLTHFAAVADAAGALAVHPLADAVVVETAATAPSLRHASRSAAMHELFADVLPERLLDRRTKSSFDGAFWGRHARELVANWDGSGLDPELVDEDRLRQEWQAESPDGRTFLLLQEQELRRRDERQLSEAIPSST